MFFGNKKWDPGKQMRTSAGCRINVKKSRNAGSGPRSPFQTLRDELRAPVPKTHIIFNLEKKAGV